MLFATKLDTDITFIVMMILKTSNAVNVSQEEEERKNGNENATAGVAAVRRTCKGRGQEEDKRFGKYGFESNLDQRWS